ncbi:hypothetical protein G3A43_39740 [Paraburkholderia aspalathi]|uniref:hypothetical protein n=1 Tax=Paraburkholderia nemoris TaxID=2793076 RepID=UPI00190ACC5E|nr:MULTISPECIES: hypothetical protein [Paraburkholderia]MBK3786338.1 hypothetical protein [Paraburkholderia aspalathi]
MDTVFSCDSTRFFVMCCSLALLFFAVMKRLVSIALVPIEMRRDPAPIRGAVQIDVLPTRHGLAY